MRQKNAMLYALMFAGFSAIAVHFQWYGFATWMGLLCFLTVLERPEHWDV
jgi:hypothetical protein